MSTITIRRFRVADDVFRHVINTETDEVFLQRLDEDWTSLLRYDPHCGAWDAKAGKQIGIFRSMDGGWWVFEDLHGNRTTCEHISEVEGLLDSEVTISKMWLQGTDHDTILSNPMEFRAHHEARVGTYIPRKRK